MSSCERAHQVDVDARVPERAVAAVADHHALRHHFGRHRVNEVDREPRINLQPMRDWRL